WNTATGKALAKLPGHREGVIGVACMPRTGALTSLGLDRQLRELPLTRVTMRMKGSGPVAAIPKTAEYRRLVSKSETGPRMIASDRTGNTPADEEPPRLVIVEILREP